MRLITIPMSHYCEKARWGLELAGITYSEEAHLQVFHYWAVRGLKSKGMVPVLVDGSQAIADSTDILKYLDQRLAPEQKLYPPEIIAEVEALEHFFDEGLGIESRRWVYFHWLKVPSKEVLRTAAQMTPYWQRALAPFVFPVFRIYLSRHLKISKRNIVAGRAIIEQAFDRVEQLLSDGRPFLCGAQFTAADLTFASMAAAILLPPEYGIRLPTLEEAPADARADVEKFRAHSAGQYALRLFKDRVQ